MQPLAKACESPRTGKYRKFFIILKAPAFELAIIPNKIFRIIDAIKPVIC